MKINPPTCHPRTSECQVKIDWDRYIDEDEEDGAGGFDTSAVSFSVHEWNELLFAHVILFVLLAHPKCLKILNPARWRHGHGFNDGVSLSSDIPCGYHVQLFLTQICCLFYAVAVWEAWAVWAVWAAWEVWEAWAVWAVWTWRH